MSIIQRLIADGTIKLYVDWRSGSDVDWTGIHAVSDLAVGSYAFRRAGIKALTESTEKNLTPDTLTTGPAKTIFYGFQGFPGSGVGFHRFLTYTGTSVQRWYLSSNGRVFCQSFPGPLNRSVVLDDFYLPHTLAMTHDGTTEAIQLYVDGVFFSAFDGAEPAYAIDRSITIAGNTLRTSEDVTNRFLLIADSVLTPDQIATVTAELESMNHSWPTKRHNRAKALSLAVQSPTPISSVSMRPSGNKLVSTPNPLDGFNLPSGAMPSRSLMGHGVDFSLSGPSSVAASYQTTGSLFWSVWFRTGDDVTTSQMVFNRYLDAADAWGLRINSATLFIYDDIDDAGFFRYSTQITPNTTYHVVCGLRADLTNVMWINAVARDNDDAALDTLASFAGETYLGARRTPTYWPFLGEILSYDVMDTEPTQDEIDQMYAQGAQALQWGSAWGTPVTTSPAAAGEPLGESGFVVASGTHDITTDTVNGSPTKCIKCATAGVVYIDLLRYMSAEDIAFGTYELTVKKASTATDLDMVLIGDTIGGLEAAGQNGYGLRWKNVDDGIYQYESVAGAITEMGHASGFTPAGTAILLHLSRRFDGWFDLWINDNDSILSSTDLTTVTGRYLSLALAAGDEVFLSDSHGRYGITKRLGVI